MVAVTSQKIWQNLFLMVILAFSAWLRFSSIHYDYILPVEVIGVKVAEMVATTGILDTNWKNADLPGEFKYPQYNFSGYLLGASGVVRIVGILGNTFDTKLLLRGLSATLGVLVIALTFLVGRQLCGYATGLCSSFLASSSLLLYQDSLYARPETFVTVLTLLALYVMGLRELRVQVRFGISAFLVGILVSTKISMLALVPMMVLLPNDVVEEKAPISQLLGVYLGAVWHQCRKQVFTIIVALLLGFVVGAPYAVVNGDDFVNGVYVLGKQYTTGHWPYGLADGGFLERLSYAGAYFVSASGWLLYFFAIVGVLAALVEKNFRLFVLTILVFIYALRFSSYPVFFERNYSHLFPLLIVLTSFGMSWLGSRKQEAGSRVVFLGVLALVGASPGLENVWKLRYFELPGLRRALLENKRVELESLLSARSQRLGVVKYYSGVDAKAEQASECLTRLLEIQYLGDGLGRAALKSFVDRNGYTNVGYIESLFEGFPSSTLRVYFTPSVMFIAKMPGNAESCAENGQTYLPRRRIGSIVSGVRVENDKNWSVRGASDDYNDPLIMGDYYGSWSGSDSNTGVIRVTVPGLGGDSEIVVPYYTGPKAERLSITIRDEQTGEQIWSYSKLGKPSDWRFLMVKLPKTVRSIVVEGVDGGDGWGQWLALGLPRWLKQDQSSQLNDLTGYAHAL